MPSLAEYPTRALSRLRRPSAERAGFWTFALHIWTVFGIALSNAFFALSAAAAFLAARRRHGLAGDWSRVLLPAGLYALLVLVASAFSYDPATSWPAAREVLNLGTLVLAAMLLRGERDVRRVVNVFIVVAAVLALAGLAQLLLGFGGIHNRIRGPFSHYMTFSGVLLLATLLLVSRIVYGRRWRSGWHWAALSVLVLAVLASLTRGVWVALAVTVTVLLLARAPRYLALVPPAVLLFLLLAPLPMVHRAVSVTDLRDRSTYDRLCMAEAGLRMIRERPLLGLGPGMVEQRYPIYRHPSSPRRSTPHLHNAFLQIAAEKGLPALAAYFWIVGAAGWLALRRFREEGGSGGPRSDLYMGVALALLAFNLAGFFEANWDDTEVQRVVLFLVATPFALEGGAAPRAPRREPT